MQPSTRETSLPPTARKLRVTVLAGGPGAERAVSLDSGLAVAEALRRRGHDVFIADIAPDQLAALDTPADVIFPALHGTFGEDGSLQRILEQRGLRYVGSDSRASAIAIDKLATKQCAERIGIPTPPYRLVTREDLAAGRPLFDPPCVIKPLDQGSSVDTAIAQDAADVRAAAAGVVERYGRALLERFVRGDELTVGIVGRRALPVICIRPKRRFYDYEAKYHDEATEYLFDAGHPAEVLMRAQSESLRLFDAIGCRHLARVDWIAEPDGALWLLEVNTLPGFTTHSLVPKAAAQVGIDFDELCDRLVRMAWEEPA